MTGVGAGESAESERGRRAQPSDRPSTSPPRGCSPTTATILSIPAGHPYVRALQPSGGWSDVRILPDPIVDARDPQRWWPHPALQAQWWADNYPVEHPLEPHLRQPTKNSAEPVDPVDAVHVHFGFEHLSVAEVEDFVAALQERHIPLVVTVHDVDNPHLALPEQQADHRRRLGVLLAAAQCILTLSRGAQEEIERRYGRTPTVVAHPPIVPNPQA
ncbi:glycosyltransferase family 4 protein, partial [Corynebacterium heidelbergense]